MRITNKKVNEAIEKLEAYFDGTFDFRTDNSRPDMSSKKYHLYQRTECGMQCDGMWGKRRGDFSTQNEFVKWVENLVK